MPLRRKFQDCEDKYNAHQFVQINLNIKELNCVNNCKALYTFFVNILYNLKIIQIKSCILSQLIHMGALQFIA